MAARISAPTRPPKATFSVLGRRRSGWPLRTTPSPKASESPSHKRSRRLCTSTKGVRSAARLAATPSAAVSSALSVPARRPPSCPAPWMNGSSCRPSRMKSAPTPFGAWNLCPAIVSRSTPSSSTRVGILPTDCAASVWKRTPYSCAIAAHSAMGWIVPVSLLACMMVTSTVSLLIARRRSSGSTSPVPSTGSHVSRAPRRSRNRSGATMAGCSALDVTKCGRSLPLAKKTPFSAWLFASLPPLVNTISRGAQPTSAATWTLALATIWRAGAPAQWLLEGLPCPVSRAWRMMSATSGATGVLALKSR